MSEDGSDRKLSLVVAGLLPFLRRYTRALTGSQERGDKYTAMTLEALLSDRTIFDEMSSDKVALFAAFHRIWSSFGTLVEDETSELRKRAHEHLAQLRPNTREALLLRSIEGFLPGEIAEIMGTDAAEVEELLEIAVNDMQDTVTGDILIIEDEAIIALQIQQIVTEIGHEVLGVARRHRDAVKAVEDKRPDLILADIQLADGSSGIDAVNDITAKIGDVPVIFITAFPERLLTGEKPEPAFLITKPFSGDQVRSAVSQAMFFSSSEVIELE